jgi:hypothetical protein
MNDHNCTCQYCIDKRRDFAETNPYYYQWVMVADRLAWMEKVAGAGWIMVLVTLLALFIVTS